MEMLSTLGKLMLFTYYAYLTVRLLYSKRYINTRTAYTAYNKRTTLTNAGDIESTTTNREKWISYGRKSFFDYSRLCEGY